LSGDNVVVVVVDDDDDDAAIRLRQRLAVPNFAFI